MNKIAILSAETGNGHIKVMESLTQAFKNKNYSVDCYRSFYEDLMPSNKIMSDFYNFLTVSSVELCCKLSELSYITRPDLTDDFYNGVKDKIKTFIIEHNYSIIISTIHTINYAFLKVLGELNLSSIIDYYIVVTDPYNPISIGFDIPGAKYYFCPTEIAADCLRRKKIDNNLISISGYPINDKFINYKTDPELYRKYLFDPKKQIALINCGSQGSYHYFDILKKILECRNDLQIIFICGKNKVLYNQVYRYVQKHKNNNIIRIFEFVDFMEELLEISSYTITKPGANTLFECLHTKTPVIIDGSKGFLFQEQGIKEYLELHRIGCIANTLDEIIALMEDYSDVDNLQYYINNIIDMQFNDAKNIIAEKILTLSGI